MWLPGAVHLSYIETEAQNQQSASVLPLFWSASLMAWHVETVCGPGQVDELSAKYQAVSIEEVEEGWKDVYERSLTSCMHGAACQQGPSCQVSMPASDLCPSESTPERPAHYKSVHLSDQQTWHQTCVIAEFCFVLAACVIIHQTDCTAMSGLECARQHNLQCGLRQTCMCCV